MESTRQDGASVRLPELDGIRGLAILLVLVWHLLPTVVEGRASSLGAYLLKIISFSWSGVDLFFVLSGFLIGGILLDNRESANYFRVFYFRRICRIFPLYFSWLILFALLRSWVFPPGSTNQFGWLFDNSMPIWSYATFTQNILMAGHGSFGAQFIDPTWSLAIEEQFYLILPFIIRYLPSRKVLPVLLGLIITAPIMRLGSVHLTNTGFAAIVLLPCRADALLLGVLCAYIMRKEKVSGYIAGRVWALYIGLAILMLLVAMLAVNDHSLGSFPMTFYGFSLVALLYGFLLLIAITEKRGVVSLFTRNYFIRKLGLLAYGIYMFHQGIYGLAHAVILKQAPQSLTHADSIVTLFALLVTILLAFFSWMYFEKPFVLMGHSARYAR